MEADDNSRFFMGVAASMLGGFLLTRIPTKSPIAVTFPVSDFFQPQAVAEVAQAFPSETEEDFVWSVWNYVGIAIKYEPIGSDMYFIGNYVSCDKCFIGADAIARTEGNCVSKSSLLASLLLNRIPDDRIALVIGEVFNTNGVAAGGHCWVEYMDPSGTWYVLESTTPPKGWIPVAVVSDQYVPHVVLSNGSYTCDDEGLCQTVTALKIGCGCDQEIRTIAARFSM